MHFIEQWLLTKFGKDSFSLMFAVGWAHRVPTRPLPSGNPPRAFLFKMLNYMDHDVILSKARSIGDALVMDNSKILLFPDFSAGKQKRAQFTEVKKRLPSLELQYAMLYPACLRVVAKDEVHFFLKSLRWQCSGGIVRNVPSGKS